MEVSVRAAAGRVSITRRYRENKHIPPRSRYIMLYFHTGVSPQRAYANYTINTRNNKTVGQ